MKKGLTLPMLLFLLLLCGCGQGEIANKDTRFLLDTVATVTADCDDETLDGAFLLCEKYERLLSRTKKESDVYKLNNTADFVNVSEETVKILNRAIYYSDLSGGRFDVTVYPLSSLWDFKNQVIPDRDEIAEALKNVDYHSIEIKENKVSLNGKQIDLGGIAKGYISDKMIKYLSDNGVKKALVNLGGNISAIGKYNIGIETPFENSVRYSITVKDKSIVTSGIYERCIKKDGKIYHHILDPKTGYGVENDLAAVTVVGDNAFDCDALSTVCVLIGKEEALKLINSTKDTEAVLFDRNNNLILSDGLYKKNYKIYFKEVAK